jgi:hypothetical protein
MRFFAVEEMVVEMEGVIRADRDLIFRAAAIEILVNVRGMVIDHDDDAMGLGGMTRIAARAGLFQELAQA